MKNYTTYYKLGILEIITTIVITIAVILGTLSNIKWIIHTIQFGSVIFLIYTALTSIMLYTRVNKLKTMLLIHSLPANYKIWPNRHISYYIIILSLYTLAILVLTTHGHTIIGNIWALISINTLLQWASYKKARQLLLQGQQQ